MESHTSAAPLLPFPFSLVSRIWDRIWDGITLPCQKLSTLPPLSLGSNAKLTRFPLTPSPTLTGIPTRSSSSSCRTVHYNGISSLLDVDYLRGGISHERSSQTSDWGSLRVLNPDTTVRHCSTDFTDDPITAKLKQDSSAPQLPEFPCARSPDTPLAVTIGVGFDNPRASLASKSQMSVNAGNLQPLTEDETLESFLLRRLNEKARSVRTTPLPRNGLTRALEIFTSPNIPGSSDADMSMIDEQSEPTDTDPVPSPRPRLPSFGSNFGTSFGLDQFCRQWLQNPTSPHSEATATAVYSQTEFAIPNDGPGSARETGSRSSRCRSTASHRWSSSTSPSLSFMSEVFHQRRPGIFVSLDNMSSLALTLTTGTVAQKRRLGEKLQPARPEAI